MPEKKAPEPSPVRLLPLVKGEKASREVDEATFSRYFAPFFDYKMRTSGKGSSEIDNLAEYYRMIDEASKTGAPPPYFYDDDGTARMNLNVVDFDDDGKPILVRKKP